MTREVLLVDDDADLRHAAAQSLKLADCEVRQADSGGGALAEIDAGFEGVVVTDIRMPGMDGLELLDRVVAREADLPVILVSGHVDVPIAMDALRRGAYDVLEKPFSVEHLTAAVERALEWRRLTAENRTLRQTARHDPGESLYCGNSPAIVHVRRTIAQIAPITVDVLVQGETGTGKGLVAEMLHAGSRRRGPLVTVDCGALPGALIEAELFGSAADGTPGQRMPRTGRIEQSDRGTLFLDNIDALSDAMQLAIQHALERREVTPVGAPGDLKSKLEAFETELIEEALTASGGDVTRTRAALGLPRKTFYYRLQKLGIDPAQFRG